MPLDTFHPAVAAWFERTFRAPTEPQLAAWPVLKSGRHALIAAPTGSGKTLAAFLAAIDELVRQSIEGWLEDKIQVVYVSPLKALSNDIHRNLEQPLAGIGEELKKLGLPELQVRAQVRTGDTEQSERAAMRRNPPHILVTTPESLYLLLTSESGREMLGTTRTVIVDEIHAVAGSKRGSHLSLSLERLAALVPHPLQRIGLSATQKPIEDVARFLVGAGRGEAPDCDIVDSGHVRSRDLGLVLPDSPLEAVMSGEVWQNVYDRLAALVQEHRTTLVFANTRRMVERVTRHLSERLGEENVAAHHGSLAKELRLDAEQRLKQGKLRALVATASLELGIDIGDVELVCQLGSPRSISTFLQRVGRANHSVSGVPKGRLFPLSRDELVEATALLAAVRAGDLDRLSIPDHPLDVLAQQIVAEVAARDYGEDELFELVCRAWPYRALERAQFDAVIRMLSEGFSTRRGRRSTYLHRDAVNRRVRARRGARLAAITSGGAIPDNADYQVVLEPAGTFVGTLNEDFAIESLAGDIFQLGNTSYRILRVEAGKVRVEDAKGQPPTIPFWLGEAPARTMELSRAVARIREEVEAALPEVTAASISAAVEAFAQRHSLDRVAAHQIVEYLAAAKAMLGHLPTQDTIVFERFFDESGGMQLVIHAPFGGRINRAFGLALRKRFCRAFNFELQAAATEDAIVLSLGETHSFVLEDVARYLNSRSVEQLLVQAVLDAPLFTTRWRWNASIALAVRRFTGGRKTPAPLQRMAAEDLISVVFPDQIACAENLTGEREIPDHPLVNQTLRDCLHEAMDVDGLVNLLAAMERGEKRVIARDLPHPSPLAQEILSARPYAYLDDAPLEERRTQAVASRRWLDPQTAADLGKLDPKAIEAVREEAWPAAENADELHDALMSVGAIREQEGLEAGWASLFEQLVADRRAAMLSEGEHRFWVAAEQLPMLSALYPDAKITEGIAAPAEFAARSWTPDVALVELVRGRLQAVGPVTAQALAQTLAVSQSSIESALGALEVEGFVLRGSFTPEARDIEWCERRLLSRIHRYTIKTLRAEIEPVTTADFMRFLLEWQGVTREPRPQGVEALAGIVEQLEGFEAPAAAWESDVLRVRMQDYDPNWLDSLCLSGRATWQRLTPPKAATGGPVRATPITLLTRKNSALWHSLEEQGMDETSLSHPARAILDYLRAHGASFFDEIVSGAGILHAQGEEGLGELVAAGLVNSDSFSGLRALLMPAERKRKLAARRRRIALFGLEDAGRWSLTRRKSPQPDAEAVEQLAWILLRRYGVVFRRMLAREADRLPPWHALLRAYRRLEAQGLIRGGRFVAGVSGEQFATPEAVVALRAVRRRPLDGALVSLSAADPLNLTGLLLHGTRVPALAGNRILLRDGAAVALHAGGETQFLISLDPEAEWNARNALLRPRVHAASARPS
ncbi:MAG TPA: DEAD/DEAH box helicase [Steroidobacteraceae bacterium]|nr:DEAD/DEAH box helicase [Steroidobacteraceae bacterium]